jgi:hypothetical protein
MQKLNMKSYWKKHRYQKVIAMVALYPFILVYSLIYQIFITLLDFPNYLNIMFQDFRKDKDV